MGQHREAASFKQSFLHCGWRALSIMEVLQPAMQEWLHVAASGGSAWK